MLSSSSAIAGPSNASTAVNPCEARLHTAFSSGALTREEYETKMKQHRQPNVPTSVATRVKGETVVAKYDWLPAAGPFETKKLATEGAHAFEHGRWKYCRKGDKKLLVCDCGCMRTCIGRISQAAAKCAATPPHADAWTHGAALARCTRCHPCKALM